MLISSEVEILKFDSYGCRSAWKPLTQYVEPGVSPSVSRLMDPVTRGCTPPRSITSLPSMNTHTSSSPRKSNTWPARYVKSTCASDVNRKLCV